MLENAVVRVDLIPIALRQRLPACHTLMVFAPIFARIQVDSLHGRCGCPAGDAHPPFCLALRHRGAARKLREASSGLS